MGYTYSDREFNVTTIGMVDALDIRGYSRLAYETRRSIHVPTGIKTHECLNYSITFYRSKNDIMAELRGWLSKGHREYFNIDEHVMDEIFHNFDVGADSMENINGRWLFKGTQDKFLHNYWSISQDFIHKFPIGKLIVNHGIPIYLFATYPGIKTMDEAKEVANALASAWRNGSPTYLNTMIDDERREIEKLKSQRQKKMGAFEEICNKSADALNVLSSEYGINIDVG